MHTNGDDEKASAFPHTNRRHGELEKRRLRLRTTLLAFHNEHASDLTFIGNLNIWDCLSSARTTFETVLVLSWLDLDVHRNLGRPTTLRQPHKPPRPRQLGPVTIHASPSFNSISVSCFSSFETLEALVIPLYFVIIVDWLLEGVYDSVNVLADASGPRTTATTTVPRHALCLRRSQLSVEACTLIRRARTPRISYSPPAT